MKNDRFLTDRQIAERYNVSRCTPWRWSRNGDFPKPVQLSPAITRWRESAVLEWEARNKGA